MPEKPPFYVCFFILSASYSFNSLFFLLISFIFFQIGFRWEKLSLPFQVRTRSHFTLFWIFFLLNFLVLDFQFKLLAMLFCSKILLQHAYFIFDTCMYGWMADWFIWLFDTAIGFNVETVQYNNIKFQVWDLGNHFN